MSNIAIEFQNVGKMYRLGRVGTGTLSHDLNRWWQMSVLGKEDPYLKIGQTNDRTTKGDSDYVWALRDISFQVEQGEVLGIIGKNGAGKSTLLKLLSNITSPSTGSIKYQGRIASLLEVGTGFHPELTGRENIYMNGSIMGMTKHEITSKLDEIVDFAGVERYLDTPVKRYSSGMTVRLGFAVAAFLEPEILVVDEVLTVGDAEFQKKAIGKMHNVSHEGGRTVLFVSHNMDSMLNLCKNGVLLENGMVKFTGDIKSTVAEYLTGRTSQSHFKQEKSKHAAFVNEVYFVGEGQKKEGLFSFNDSIHFKVKVKKKTGLEVDKAAVAGICIYTDKGLMMCVAEQSLKPLQEHDSITFDLEYPSEVLMPGRYIIQVDLHIPNVCYLDKQETVNFTVFDNGSEFLKYNGSNNGVIMLRPNVVYAVE